MLSGVKAASSTRPVAAVVARSREHVEQILGIPGYHILGPEKQTNAEFA